MATGKPNTTAILWFLAAACALTAFTIRAASGEMPWYLAAAGVFLVALGFRAVGKPGRPVPPDRQRL